MRRTSRASVDIYTPNIDMLRILLAEPQIDQHVEWKGFTMLVPALLGVDCLKYGLATEAVVLAVQHWPSMDLLLLS